MNTTSSDAKSQLAPPPRMMSILVRRRAWSDPITRFFWLIGIVLILIAATFFITGRNAWRRESQLISQGAPVDAVIHAVTDSTQSTITRPKASADPSSPVVLQFPWKSQTYITRRAIPLEGYAQLAVVGDLVHIHVDPQNPENWTALAEPMPLRDRVMGAILTFPAALALFAAAIVRRRAVVRLWRHGIVTPSLLLSSSISALSPLGRLARCTPAAEGDSRVFTVYLPGRRTAPEPGAAIDLLTKAAPSQCAVAVEFFA
jgi:hypothetical protein